MKSVVFACGLLLVTPAHGEEALYRVTGGNPVPAAANGFHQEVTPVTDGVFEVHVVTSQAPIESAGTYGSEFRGETPDVPEGFALPGRLAKKLTPDLDAWEAATIVLEWAANHIAVDTGDEAPQDAVSVLARGRGRCSGLANATVALMRAAGFEARTVSGLLMSDSEPIPHRWIEVRLPAAGWVPSDPTLGLWTVTPRHLVFADTVTTSPRVQVLEMDGDGLNRLPRRSGRLLRPNRGADLVCRFQPPLTTAAPLAVLRGGGGEIRRAHLDPEARFSGLLPGRWVLEVEAGGEIIERRTLVLRSGGYHSFTITGSSIPPETRPGS